MPSRRSRTPHLAALTAAVLLVAAALLGPALRPAGGSARAADAPPVDAPPMPDGFSLQGADLDAGRELFVKHCAVCHGETGAGDGKLSPHMEPAPGNLQVRADERSDWELFVTVRDGGKAVGLSPVMVGFGGRLSDEQLREVAAYTRELAEEDGG